MKLKMAKILMTFLVATVLALGYGCGSKGDLYLPKASQTQATDNN
jgi:predicted small lipoprotein YifL